MENRKATEAGQDITMQKEDFAALWKTILGLIQAFDQIKSDIPVIVRLTGTNEHIGRDLLRNHSRFQIATTMQEAALMAIKS